ncbi:MAG: hypothetical protein ACM31L_15030 [Actinomycetota bacterium]
MDELRRFAETTVRRWVGAGALAVAAAVAPLIDRPALALPAGALLLSLAAALLWQMSHMSGGFSGGPAWLPIERGRGRSARADLDRLFGEALAQWALRAALAAALAWAAALGRWWGLWGG